MTDLSDKVHRQAIRIERGRALRFCEQVGETYGSCSVTAAPAVAMVTLRLLAQMTADEREVLLRGVDAAGHDPVTGA